MGRLEYVAEIWTDILDLLGTEKSESTIKKILQLFDMGDLSITMTYEMILTIYFIFIK